MITSIGFVLLILAYVFDTDEESIFESVLDILAFAGALLFMSGIAIFFWRTMP